jgi:hypothetical protein
MNTLVSKLFSLAVVLFPFGGIYEPKWLGYLSASPAIPIFAFLGIFSLLTTTYRSHQLRRLTCFLYFWGLAVSILSLVIFGWSELSGVKTISYAVLCAAWFCPFLCLIKVSLRDLRVALTIGLFIYFIAYISSDLFPNFLPISIRHFLFNGDYFNYEDMRPRGFHTEPSHFASSLGGFLFSLFLVLESQRSFSNKRFIKFLLICTLCMVATGSKGSSITMLVVICSLGISRQFFKYIALLLPVIYFIAISQYENILFDIENFTSVSTRFAMTITALLAFIYNLLGYGFYGFYDVMRQFGPMTSEYLSSSNFNLQEFNWIIDNLQNVSFKSSLLDFLVMFGITFLIFIYLVARKINFRDPRAKAGFIYYTLSAFSVEGHNSILIFMGITILFLYYKNRSSL